MKDFIDFLLSFHGPQGPYHLYALPCEGGAPKTFVAQSPADFESLRLWVKAKQDDRHNIYFSPARVRPDVASKATKGDMVSSQYVWVDMDVPKGTKKADFDQQRQLLLDALGTNRPDHPESGRRIPAPTYLIDSGGGYWGFWKLTQAIDLTTDEGRNELEARNLAVEQAMGADHCHNADRIARLPFTQNIPGSQKAATRGTDPLPSFIVSDRSQDEDFVYDANFAFPKVDKLPSAQKGDYDITATYEAPSGETTRDALVRHKVPASVARKIMSNLRGPDGSELTRFPGDRSKVAFPFWATLARAGVSPQAAFEIMSTSQAMREYLTLDSSGTPRGRDMNTEHMRQLSNAYDSVSRERAEKEAKEAAKEQKGQDAPDVAEVFEQEEIEAVVSKDRDGCFHIPGWGGAIPEEYGRPEQHIKLIAQGDTNGVQMVQIRGPHETIARSPQDLKIAFSHIKLTRVGKGEKTITKSYGEWLTDYPHIQVYDDLMYDPRVKGNQGNLYNLYEGFTIQPTPGEKHALYKDHVRNVICGGDEDKFEYVWSWMAFGLQNPGAKTMNALVLRGAQGCGKGMFVQTLGKLYGDAFYHSRAGEALTGRFNGPLSRKQLVFADEFKPEKVSGKKADKMKMLITEATLEVEKKYVNSAVEPNLMNIIIASNHEHVVSVEGGDRRYVILDMSPCRVGDHDYFQSLMDLQNDEEAMSHLMHDLMNHDIEDWSPIANAPYTKGRGEQLIQSMNMGRRALFELLEKGYLPNGGDVAHMLPQPLLETLVHKDNGGKLADVRRQLSSAFKETFMDHWRAQRKPMEETVLQHITLPDIKGTEMNRYTAWRMPDLDTARRLFAERHISAKFEWPEVDNIARETFSMGNPETTNEEPF